jgi:hypothetical protein
VKPRGLPAASRVAAYNHRGEGDVITYRLLPIAVLTAAMLACHTDLPSRAQASDLGCHEATSAIEEMHASLTLPPNFSERNATKHGGEFDANRIFEALSHLKMKDGFTLDYVYHQDGMGGYPVLYARPVDQQPYSNEAEYNAAPKQPDYLASVTPEESSEGYFEYLVFAMTANQFYQDWHANYNDWQVLCGMDDVEEVIRSLEGEDAFGRPMTAAQKQAARAIQAPRPSVVSSDETATVTTLVFTKWGGFYRRTLTINRADHSIVDERDEPLVEYDCGIAF